MEDVSFYTYNMHNIFEINTRHICIAQKVAETYMIRLSKAEYVQRSYASKGVFILFVYLYDFLVNDELKGKHNSNVT